MAEAVLFDITGELIKKLGSRVVQKHRLYRNVEGALTKLKGTLSEIHGVLLHAEEQHSRNPQVRDWLGKLKEAVYDADDLLDDFFIEALHPQLMTEDKISTEVCPSSFSLKKLPKISIGDEIKSIAEKLGEIAAERNFDFDKRKEETSSLSRKRESTDSYVLAEDVIGRDGDKQEIIKILFNTEENILIVPIVGIGGLGKTTLAQLVYNDEKVKTQFELRMWVCVSDHFDLESIVREIIKSATDKDLGNLEIDQLQNNLRKEIHGKKYLLVLDDLWNEDTNKWRELESLLKGGKIGSRIIVTSRSRRVAEATSAFSPYVLKGLSENEAWVLFVRVAFKQGEESKNQSMVEIGKKIVKKCAGVPLAIRTIGALLSFKDSKDEWSEFEDKVSSGITEEAYNILPTLKLSYDHLPSHLKNCFAYCRLFPKDYNINVSELINLWMAQGFIQSSDGSHFEVTGFRYFKKLLWTSFFQEVKKDELGNITHCKMHDLMHDLAVVVGGQESIILKSNGESFDDKNRYVSFDFTVDSTWQIASPFLGENKIRTFFMPSQKCKYKGEPFSEASCNSIILNSRSVRALDFHGLNLLKIPNFIGKLKHLRYLDLSENRELETLPDSVTELQILQVLKLFGCWSLKSLPTNIERLVSLRCLEISECYELTYMQPGIGQLSSLRRLDRFIVSKGDVACGNSSSGFSELEKLNNLKGDLIIENLGYLKGKAVSECTKAKLKAKEHLGSLRLQWDASGDYYGDVEEQEMSMKGLQPHGNLKGLYVNKYKGVSFPSWLSSLSKLVQFNLYECKKCKYLPQLRKLTCLQSLKIDYAYSIEYIEDSDVYWGTSGGEEADGDKSVFPCLKELVLKYCYKLKGWWKRREDGDRARELPWFPRLSQLVVYDCPKLTSMPSFPSVEGWFRWENNSGVPLQQTMKMKIGRSAASSHPLPLSKLQHLHLERIEDIESLPEEGLRNLTSLKSLRIVSFSKLITLPWEGFKGLTSLCSLTIERCGKLNSLSGVFQHMPALEHLTIEDCKELDLSDLDDLQSQGLPKLSSLKLKELPQLVAFPDCLQHVLTLGYLEIGYCPNLRSLPDWMGQLTSLQRLTVDVCHALTAKCRKNCSEWPKIAHISYILLDGSVIR